MSGRIWRRERVNRVAARVFRVGGLSFSVEGLPGATLGRSPGHLPKVTSAANPSRGGLPAPVPPHRGGWSGTGGLWICHRASPKRWWVTPADLRVRLPVSGQPGLPRSRRTAAGRCCTTRVARIGTLAFYTSFVGRRALLADVRERLDVVPGRHARGAWRGGEDPGRPADRRGGAAHLPRGMLGGVARRPGRARAAEPCRRRGARPAGRRPAMGGRDSRRPHCRPHRAAGARQLRTPPPRCQRSGGGAPRDLPERQVPAHQQAAAQAQRRGRHRGPAAQPPRRGDRGHAGGHHPLRGRQPVRGPRHLGTLRLRADPGQRGGRRSPCAATWTGSRWPSSWPLPGSGRCRRRRSATASPNASRCSTWVTATPTNGTSRCGPASSGPTTCAPSPSSGSGRGRRCSPAAATSRPQRPSVGPTICPLTRSST